MLMSLEWHTGHSILRILSAGLILLNTKHGRLNPELTIDDLHLNGKGYRILSTALKQAFNGQEHL